MIMTIIRWRGRLCSNLSALIYAHLQYYCSVEFACWVVMTCFPFWTKLHTVCTLNLQNHCTKGFPCYDLNFDFSTDIFFHFKLHERSSRTSIFFNILKFLTSQKIKVIMFWQMKNKPVYILFTNTWISKVCFVYSWCITCELNKPKHSGDETKLFPFLNMSMVHLLLVFVCVPLQKYFNHSYLRWIYFYSGVIKPFVHLIVPINYGISFLDFVLLLCMYVLKM